MSTVRTRAVENASEITSMLVIGLGLLALFTGWPAIPFWVIFAVGFVVVVPIVSTLTGEDEDESAAEEATDETSPLSDRSDDADALATLRERYARGELTDEQFERKLDRLFETEYPESAAEWRTREREHEHERA